MKIKTLALSEGVSTDIAYRAARWAFTHTGGKFQGSRRYGGGDLTSEEVALCRQYIRERGSAKTRKAVPEQDQYEAKRQTWLETWGNALRQANLDGKDTMELLAVYGLICIAKDRALLQLPVDGAKLGDLALELCYSAGVDYDFFNGPEESSRWQGFTRYLIDQGFESPGWGLL